MAREHSMLAVLHCLYGVVDQRFFKKKAGTDRVFAMGPAHLKKQQILCQMSDDDADPSKQFKDGFNGVWQLF
jgi:hypothetical protein